MESGQISDHQITASTYGPAFQPKHARLRGSNVWLQDIAVGATNQWLQIDLEQQLLIRGVATQGRPDVDHWVEEYFVDYSLDGQEWIRYSEPKAGSDNHEKKVKNE